MRHTTSKQIKGAYEIFLNSTDFCLEQVYGSFSNAKQQAYNYCLDILNEYNGTRPRIIGHNTSTFSFGCYGVKDGREIFIYITKSYDRFIYIDEI